MQPPNLKSSVITKLWDIFYKDFNSPVFHFSQMNFHNLTQLVLIIKVYRKFSYGYTK